jgi:hypothetical protein
MDTRKGDAEVVAAPDWAQAGGAMIADSNAIIVARETNEVRRIGPPCGFWFVRSPPPCNAHFSPKTDHPRGTTLTGQRLHDPGSDRLVAA